MVGWITFIKVPIVNFFEENFELSDMKSVSWIVILLAKNGEQANGLVSSRFNTHRFRASFDG